VPTEQGRSGSWSLPGYQIGEVLGRGGFATVYRARQLSLDRDVAVKVLNADLATPGDRRRFERERSALSRLSVHPNVVEVHDAGITAENRPYLVMRLYPNGSLSDRLSESGPVPADEVVAMVTAIACALDEAHGAGILHRDVKPSNVLLSQDGTPILADFGIAGLVTPEPDSSHFSTAVFSLAHVAPEILSEHRYSVASDVYALASTTYQLLTGRPPFPPRDPRIGSLILDEPPPQLDVPGLPPQLEAAVLRGLAKNPEYRPRSAGDFARSLTDPIPQEATAAVTTLIPPRSDPSTAVTQPALPPTAAAQSTTPVPPFGTVADLSASTPVAPVSRSRRRPVGVVVAVAVTAVAILLAGVGIARLVTTPDSSAATDVPTMTSSVTVESSTGSSEAATADDGSTSSASSEASVQTDSSTGATDGSYDVAAAPRCTHSDDLDPFTEVDVSGAAKSSEFGVSYAAANLVDGNTSTTWVEGADGLGKGESVTFTFSRPVTVVTACLVNGYGKSTDLYRRNARVRTLDVITDNEQFTVGLTDLGLTAAPSTFQELPLPEQVVTQVTLRLRSFYGPDQLAGKTSYEDTCLSEVQFWYLPEPGL
jgi:serine/threonine protein kinase